MGGNTKFPYFVQGNFTSRSSHDNDNSKKYLVKMRHFSTTISIQINCILWIPEILNSFFSFFLAFVYSCYPPRLLEPNDPLKLCVTLLFKKYADGGAAWPQLVCLWFQKQSYFLTPESTVHDNVVETPLTSHINSNEAWAAGLPMYIAIEVALDALQDVSDLAVYDV